MNKLKKIVAMLLTVILILSGVGNGRMIVKADEAEAMQSATE